MDGEAQATFGVPVQTRAGFTESAYGLTKSVRISTRSGNALPQWAKSGVADREPRDKRDRR